MTRRWAFGLWLFALLGLALGAQPVWASHDGPMIVVDVTSSVQEDHDGDHHFRTLQAALEGPPAPNAYDTILVEPGRYEGDLEIRVEGLTLRSIGGASQTTIAGRVIIRARNVRLEGFSIEGRPTEPAVTIASENAMLQSNRIYGSRIGVLIEGANEAALERNQIYNHSGDGLVIREVWSLMLRENEVRGNGGIGVWIERSYDLLIEKNAIAFNQLGGLWLRGSQRAQLMLNVIRDNLLAGVALEETSEARVESNQLLSNDAGILLLSAINNHLKANEIRQQRMVGLVLKNGAQGNVIEQNVIQGSQGRGAIGVRLAGSVFSNQFLENRLLENGVGLVLGVNEAGGPANNVFERNEIVRSDHEGVILESEASRNRFLANAIHQNLRNGIASAGKANIYEQNEIYHNGAAGMALQGSQDERLEGNSVFENGAEGVRLEGASGTFFVANEIVKNVREGLQIREGRLLRLLQNTLAGNGSSGLYAEQIENLSLKGNRIRGNRDFGVHFVSGRELLLESNEIEANQAGGIRLDGVQGADLTANRVTENLHYGLFVFDSEGISARRNFWGDEHGPAGTFSGAGNAVLGLPLAEVTPWLPAEPDDLVLSSVSALVIDSPRGPRIEFDASDRLGLILEMHQPGRGEPGRSELIAQGIVVAARYASRPTGVPPLGLEMAFYAITVEGLDAGTAELTVFYGEEDQPSGVDPEKLQLFVLEAGQWEPLSGRADPKLQRVTGEIDLKKLDGKLIGLGMLQPEMEQQSNISPGLGKGGPSKRASVAVTNGRQTLNWPVSSLLVLASLAWLFFLVFYIPRSRFWERESLIRIRENRP